MTLRLRLDEERQIYTRRQSLALMDDGSGAGVRIEARSEIERRTMADDRVLEHARYRDLQLLRGGEAAGAHPRLRGIDQLIVQHVMDARGATLVPPRAAGRPATSPDLHSAVLAVLRLLNVQRPEGPVVPGTRWEGEPIEWDSPPSHRLSVVVEPAWRLRDITSTPEGERVARVDWETRFRVLPFAAMAGTTLEGAGTIEGTSRLFVTDGRLDRSELDLRVSVGPSGAAGLSLFRFEAKYEEVLTTRTETFRPLVPSVRLEGTLPRRR